MKEPKPILEAIQAGSPPALEHSTGKTFRWITHLIDRRLQALRLLYHNVPFWVRGAPDHLPIPPMKLRSLIWSSNADLWTFFEGQDNWKRIPNLLDLLTKHGVRINQLEAILDFGCGCGRDMRQFYGLRNVIKNVQLYGTDINQDQINWCNRNLPFATFGLNGPEPPLQYGDDKFGLIYNYSVFTHLNEAQQHTWIHELARVLKPGGFLMLTVCGESYLNELNDSQKEQFNAGQLVVRHPHLAGKPADYGACAAYHPPTFVQNKLAAGFRIVEFIPGLRAMPGSMDQYLLRKGGYE